MMKTSKVQKRVQRNRLRPKHGLDSTTKLSKKELALLDRNWNAGSASFGSVRNLQKATGLTKEKVEKFLPSKDAYTKFFVPQRKSYARLPIKAFDLDHIWLYQTMEKKILLVNVDVLSRFVRAEPMKSLSSQQTKETLARVINNAPKAPDKVWTDQGKEFEGDFKRFCTVMAIEKYHTDSGTKASLAERAIRSVKALIVPYLEEKWLWRYTDKLPAFIATINRRVNRSTGLTPNSVDKSHVLYLTSLQDNKIKERTPKFNEGDIVRIASKNTPFRKGYRQHFY